MTQETKKLNASQRLETLEYNFKEIESFLNNVARDISVIKEAIKLLGNKTDSIQRAANISDDTVAELMKENNANELKEKVDDFVSKGILVSSDVVSEQTFLVGHEVDDDGKVINPRIQFATSSSKPEIKEKLMGAKVGDSISFSEGTLKLIVQEVYKIVTPESVAQAAESTEQQA